MSDPVPMRISIRELMAASGVAFGTSGVRGLAASMTDLVCYACSKGFLQYLEGIGELKRRGEAVLVAGDFRPSTDRVMEAVCRAAEDMSYRALNCGKIPSPAVVLHGLEQKLPAIMVTGSHIPDDRNGIKFNKITGELLKDDEKGMTDQTIELDDALFDAGGWFRKKISLPRPISTEAGEQYIARYLDFFDRDALAGLRVGVYQHSAVGRDVLMTVVSSLGAEAVALGRSEKFIPVDTEAIRPEDAALAQAWAMGNRFDAIVSLDGDSDRPLVSDEKGYWLRGDVAGILCARFLEADSVCTPVSCNTAVEKCGWFKQVLRTRIGSPYVVAAMLQASAAGGKLVVGYEANGGFLLNSDVERDGRQLRALPTRDAIIVVLSILMMAQRLDKRISELVAGLPARSTASDRLQNFAPDKSRAILARFNLGSLAADKQAIESVFRPLCGTVTAIDRLDGLRITFANDEIVHLRPSGNAPEFRCYTEAQTADRASAMNQTTLRLLMNLHAV